MRVNQKKLQFEVLLNDLVNFKLINKNNVVKNIIYFKVMFQQKSFDNLNLNKICKNIYVLFPLKDCAIFNRL